MEPTLRPLHTNAFQIVGRVLIQQRRIPSAARRSKTAFMRGARQRHQTRRMEDDPSVIVGKRPSTKLCSVKGDAGGMRCGAPGAAAESCNRPVGRPRRTSSSTHTIGAERDCITIYRRVECLVVWRSDICPFLCCCVSKGGESPHVRVMLPARRCALFPENRAMRDPSKRSEVRRGACAADVRWSLCFSSRPNNRPRPPTRARRGGSPGPFAARDRAWGTITFAIEDSCRVRRRAAPRRGASGRRSTGGTAPGRG